METVYLFSVNSSTRPAERFSPRFTVTYFRRVRLA